MFKIITPTKDNLAKSSLFTVSTEGKAKGAPLQRCTLHHRANQVIYSFLKHCLCFELQKTKLQPENMLGCVVAACQL
jgi:hypothetical protein